MDLLRGGGERGEGNRTKHAKFSYLVRKFIAKLTLEVLAVSLFHSTFQKKKKNETGPDLKRIANVKCGYLIFFTSH